MVRSTLSSVRCVARQAACPRSPKHVLRDPDCLEALLGFGCEGVDLGFSVFVWNIYRKNKRK